MIAFILADLRRLWAGSLTVLLLVALATALGSAVTLEERALRLGSARAAEAFDLVVGAGGSETQLVLSSVFLQPAPLPLMPGEVLTRLNADPGTDYAAPIGFGDFFEGRPIVGTTLAMTVDAGRRPLAEGRSFQVLGDAVVGADAGLPLGTVIRPMHGLASEGGHVHGAVRYTVVGRMARTGSPWDRAILVPIQAVWQVHGLGHHDDDEDVAGQAAHEEAAHDEAAQGEAHEHEGEANFDPARPVPAALTGELPGLPAILVKPKAVADAYKLRQKFRGGGTVAVFPGEVLTRLYGTLGDVRAILSAVAAGSQALVAAAIGLLAIIHVTQRRRQIGALRAFGAPRLSVFTIVWAELFLLVGAGVLAGLCLGYLAAQMISAHLSAGTAVPMPVEFQAGDLGGVAMLFAGAALLAAVPALLAYRQPAAEALRG